MKLLFALVMLIIGSLLFSCSSVDNQNSSQRNGKPQTSLDAEALAEYKKIIENHYVQCGDSYYTELTILQGNENRKYILRFKDFSFGVKGSSGSDLTEAANLNGFEWEGKANATYSAGRFYEQGKGWSEWQSYVLSKMHPLQDGFLDKKDSAWRFAQSGNGSDRKAASSYHDEKLKKVNCADIPQ